MKAYKLEVIVIDYDDAGIDNIKDSIENWSNGVNPDVTASGVYDMGDTCQYWEMDKHGEVIDILRECDFEKII